MKQYAMLETKAGKLSFYVFLFAMLVLARDTLVTSCVLGFTKSQFLMLGLICLFGLGFLAVNRRVWKEILTDRRMLLLAISTVVLLLPMAAKQDWQMMYFSILICLYFAVFVSYFATLEAVAAAYVAALVPLCLYSVLTTYILKGLATAGLVSIPTFYNDTGEHFFHFGLSFVVTDVAWHRNFGIFREPGVYQFFLLLGLYLNNYAVSWKKHASMWIANAVFAVTMLTTFAVGGVIEMGLFAVFLYFDKKWYCSKPGKILGLGAVAAAAAGGVGLMMIFRTQTFGNTIFYEIYDMFLRLTTKSDSLVDRISAIFVNVDIFLKNPLFGDTVANVLHGTTHNTSSTLILFAMLGIFGGTLNVLAWASLTWKRERSLVGNGVLLVILFMSFNTQNLVADVFFWLFPMLALTLRGLPLLEQLRKKTGKENP